MNNMKLTHALLVACLCSTLCFTGCTERREGLGGGGVAPVKVTLLTDGGDAGVDDAANNAAPEAKITTFGTFKGRIVVEGDVPSLTPLLAANTPGKPFCSKSAIPDESIVIGEGGGLANVFVYIAKTPNADIPPLPSDPITVDQQGCKFLPHALIFRTGQTLKLINSDAVAHNVGISGANKNFNQTLSANDKEGLEIQFNRPEKLPAATRCDFHGWMSARMLPLDHPWFALTSDDGTFEIPNVPATDLQFIVWHEKTGYIERKLKVTVPADGTVERTITVSAADLTK